MEANPPVQVNLHKRGVSATPQPGIASGTLTPQAPTIPPNSPVQGMPGESGAYLIGDRMSECDEFCHYGPAPHVCFYKIPGASMGQSQPIPESEWPDSFEPDSDVPGLGIHHNCGWKRPAKDRS